MKRSLLPLLFLLSVFVTVPAQVSRSVVTGLKAEVTVRRDARWIPYIEAANDADAYFAQGYITASDRLWQMDLMRRLARGETAEIFGNTTLEEDKRWRRFNFANISEGNLAVLSPDLRAALDSYARGVNAYIATLTDETLPVEFRILRYKPREWRPADSIVLGKVLADALSTTWRNDLLRASLRDIQPDRLNDLLDQVTPHDVVLFGTDTKRPVGTPGLAVVSPAIAAQAENDDAVRRRGLEMIGLYAEGLAASNNWVIAGKRTVDGTPILANDPHLSPTAPGIWYLTHLSSPTMRVAGVTLPGVPGILLGHNETIAWGATNVGPDVQDLYVETFDASGKYKTPTGWETPVIRKETINVRSAALNPETKPVEFEVVETRHGPIILEEGGRKYALRWTALDPQNTEFETFYLWNRAKSWDEFKNALKRYGGPAQNFVYADTRGNIGWYAASRIPIRRTGDGALPYDGSTNDGDWTGFIPFEELPNLYNPPSGLIVTANQRIVGTGYKYQQMSRDAAPPWRARRILDLLEAKPKLTMNDVRAIQHDDYAMPLVRLAKYIVETKAASEATIALLRDWDGRMMPESRGAVIANEIRNCMANEIAKVNPNVPATIIRERVLDRAVSERLQRWVPQPYKTFEDLVRNCDLDVRRALSAANRLGPDTSTWTWGKVWLSRFNHPLASAPFIGAQFATPNVAYFGSYLSPNVGSAVSMRHVTSPGNWDRTHLVIPLGQSGDPKSPYFKDQFEAWRTGTHAVFPFTKAAVEVGTKEVWKLGPK